MYTRKRTVLYMIVVTLFLSSLAVKVSAATFKVGFNPPTISVALGQEVTANITLSNVPSPGIYSYQLKLTYNATLLNATNAVIPTDHMFKPVTAGKIFVVDSGTVDQTLGQVSFALTLLGAEPGKTGNGTMVSVTFMGLATGNSALGIIDLIFVDPTGNQILESSYTIEPGSVTIIPEFSTAVLIAVFTIMSAAAVALKKKRQWK